MEATLGIYSGLDLALGTGSASASLAGLNVTAAMAAAAGSAALSKETQTALLQAVPILTELAAELDFGLFGIGATRQPLVAK